jgi:NADP-dependent 3-hydroxy acid dehydrogenase YdfG
LCGSVFSLGDTVLLCGSSPKVFEVQEALQKKEGSKAILDAFQFDLRNPEEIYTAFEAIENRYHHLDVLVNNAGIARGGKIEEISLEDWNEMMAVNLSSCFCVVSMLYL